MLSVRDSILQSLRKITLIDPHTHINPHNPASQTLADLLGYHYYTELAHSSGMPKSQIESAADNPRELVRRLVGNLAHLSNTAQYAWLIEICRQLYGFEDDTLTLDNWEPLYDRAEQMMQSAQWPTTVLEKANVAAVFLTNDFDDPLTGFDASVYIPCLRTDDLVFHLAKPTVRQRLEACTGISQDGSLSRLREALQQRFEHFVAGGARACAISLPPDFTPARVSDGRAATALQAVLKQGVDADPAHRGALARRIFWTLAELCDQYGLPFDLMIGVNREVYRDGVFQGRDLYDSRVSLIQYAELFNAFPNVQFPVSVLASVTNQELVSYAWIFPNVVTNGHWWYSNTPTFIRKDAAARLEAVPRNKQIGYYSDAYKLEFVAPKFDMYRQILAGILTEDFIAKRGWSEERAVELGYQILRGNVETIFPDLRSGAPSPALPSSAQATSTQGTSAPATSAPATPVSLTATALAGAAAIAGQTLASEPPAEPELDLELELLDIDNQPEQTLLHRDPHSGELTWQGPDDDDLPPALTLDEAELSLDDTDLSLGESDDVLDDWQPPSETAPDTPADDDDFGFGDIQR